jgi:hypothetical protein
MGLVQSKSFEDLLADGLESAMQKGAKTLEDYVNDLNQLNVRGPNGQRWSAELLCEVLADLGR